MTSAALHHAAGTAGTAAGLGRLSGQRVLIKYGGNALADGSGEAEALDSFAEDVVMLREAGVVPIVVHGGGPQIGALMERLGKVPEFRDGLRVTDAETLDIARMVLVGKVNRDLVEAINARGPVAVGLSGEDGGSIVASPRDPGLGFVGDIAAVDPRLLERLLADGYVPVIATIGTDNRGQAYNINADTVAGALAEALACETLVFLTDVPGLRAGPGGGEVIDRATPALIDEMIADGSISEGMIPKAGACAAAVRHGVPGAHIVDGRVRHAVVRDLASPSGTGTAVLAQ